MKKRHFQGVLPGLVALLFFSGSHHGVAGDTRGASGHDGIAVSGYVRLPIPGQSSTAAYATIENSGAAVVTLEGISTPVASSAEMHDMVMEGGQARMRSLEMLEIGVGSRAVFEPGGKHIMLSGIVSPLKVGQQVTLSFCFSSGCHAVELPVKGLDGHDAHRHHH